MVFGIEIPRGDDDDRDVLPTGLLLQSIVVSVLLLSMKIFAPLGRQLERGRKRLFDRGIWVGNRGNLLVVTSVTAIRDLLS
jgi:hypothetical protein